VADGTVHGKTPPSANACFHIMAPPGARKTGTQCDAAASTRFQEDRHTMRCSCCYQVPGRQAHNAMQLLLPGARPTGTQCDAAATEQPHPTLLCYPTAELPAHAADTFPSPISPPHGSASSIMIVCSKRHCTQHMHSAAADSELASAGSFPSAVFCYRLFALWLQDLPRERCHALLQAQLHTSHKPGQCNAGSFRLSTEGEVGT
jgi:hypothetical protein